ncbi:MAG: SDR family oxidoreductase [Rhodospirillaceae bacterium]|nr:SDR family oxidoreductase [Rhodospirillaceae bacterium]
MGDALSGARVLVTGSSRGIGLAVAAGFALAGARVVLHGSRPGEMLDGAAAAIAALTGGAEPDRIAADLTDAAGAEEVVRRAAECLGGLDVLVNNAGTMMGRNPSATVDDATIARIVDLNARSAVIATRTALEYLKPPLGSVIFTSSISARTGGSAGSALYSAAKAFVSTYARALATEFGPQGVRVNVVSPGTIATDFHQRYSSPEKLADTAKRIPLRRLGRAEDCVGAYLFLACPALSGYVTGQVLEVNGGQSMP